MSDVSYRRPRMPLVVLALAGAIVAVFVLTGQFNPDNNAAINLLALVPARFDALSLDGTKDWLALALPLFGHAFGHYGFLHITMNMLAYLQAAPFLAQRVGAARFLALFFISELGGAAAYVLINAHSENPMVGASGAICGLFGAYFLAVRPTPQAALADPQVRNAIFSFLGINVVLMGVLAALHILPIAWEAHLGGFLAGGASYLLFAPRTRTAGPWG